MQTIILLVCYWTLVWLQL